MRKLIAGLVLIFAAAFVVGSVMAAKPLPGNCTYRCDCMGNPLKCCTFDGVTTCKPTMDIGCPQIITC